MDAIRTLAFLRSEPPCGDFSGENMARFHPHVEEMDLAFGVVSACQGDPAGAFEVRLAVGGPCGPEPLTSRNLRAGTST